MRITTLFLTFLFAMALPLAIMASNDCMPKPGQTLVNDFADLLSKNQQNTLEEKLREVNRASSNQIVLIITNELCDYEPMEYATHIGHDWGVGHKEFDNGVVLLVSPEHRKTFIAVGYGLEGAIPDAVAKRIVNQELLPHFREDDYYGGISAAVGVLAQLATGEINAGDYNAKGDSPLLVLGIVLFLVLLFFVVGPMASAAKYASVNDVAFWTAFMLIMNSRGSHSGMYGDFSGGRGHFGGGFGSSGGGFGGFGGGGFGGGGAGGSW